MLRVLTLGDGNLSFSLALLRLHQPSRRERRRRQRLQTPPSSSRSPASAMAIDEPLLPPLRLSASVYEGEEAVALRYPESVAIAAELRRRGAELLFNVDATDIARSVQGERQRQRSAQPQTTPTQGAGGEGGEADGSAEPVWDVLIFHHPHSGREDVRYHRCLLSHFFHSALRVTHPHSCVAVSLCQQQPRAWQVQQRAAQWGWTLAQQRRWEEDMRLWQQLGYSHRRHHNGKAFNGHAVQQRHHLILRRQGQNDHNHDHATASPSSALEVPPLQSLLTYPAHLRLLFPQPAGKNTEEGDRGKDGEQQPQRKEADDDKEEQTQECDNYDYEQGEADASSPSPRCAVCRESLASSSAVHGHSAAVPVSSSSMPPIDPAETSLRCSVCRALFVDARALRQHSERWKEREDHALQWEVGEGRRRRQSRLMSLGYTQAAAAIQQRKERKKCKRLHQLRPTTPASRLSSTAAEAAAEEHCTTDHCSR